MQRHYTTIVAIVVLVFNLWTAIQGGYMDLGLLVLAIIQILLIGLHIGLQIAQKRKQANQNASCTTSNS